MKKLILPFFLLFYYGTQAQLSIIPGAGVNLFRTSIKPGDLPSFTPLGTQISPNLSVRMAYNLKSGQGAFIGVSTNSAAVQLTSTDPENLQTMYAAAVKRLQLRFEGGYQFTSQPIALKKSTNNIVNAGRYAQKSGSAQKPGCSRSMCSRMRGSANRYANTVTSTTAKQGLFMRIKPSVGLALAPAGSEIARQTNGPVSNYSYTSGWHKAIIAGTAFEFGTREQSRFVVSLQYLRSLGNNSQTVSNGDAFKPTVATFSAVTSGFNISLGIPFNLKKKTVVIAPTPVYRSNYHGQCTRYRLYQ